MVDINLFKDEESDEQELTPAPDNTEDSLDGLDDFDFDEPLNEFDSGDLDVSLEEDTELLEDEGVPDLDGEVELEPEHDFDYGEAPAKGTPLWVWGALAGIMALVFLWFFVIQPKLRQPSPSQARLVNSPVTTPVKALPDTTQKIVPVEKDSVKTAPVSQAAVTVKAEGLGAVPVYTAAVGKIIENFTGSGQFAGIFLSGEGFFAVEYVSRSKGVGPSMAHRVKTLLGVEQVKVSPEDGHRIAGKNYYLGVISGTLPAAGDQSQTGTGSDYASGMAFERAVKQLAAQHQQRVTGFEKLGDHAGANKRQSDYRIKLQGARSKLAPLLEGLKTLGGNAYVVKMNLAPSNYTDFKAQSVKLTLEYRLIH